MLRFSSILWAPLVALAIISTSWATPQYGLIDLGPGLAYGINDFGDVAGKVRTSALYGPAIWQSGVPRMLPASSTGTARDINNAGVVVGEDYGCPFPYGGVCGVVWTPPYGATDKTYLPGLVENPAGVYAPGGVQVINQGGSVAGHSFSRYDYLSSGFTDLHGTFWDPNGTPTDIGVLTPGDEGFAWGINEAGDVVGDSDGRVYFWGGPGNPPVEQDVFPYSYGNHAYDVNNANQFVGSYKTANGYIAYRYDLPGFTLTTIGHLGLEGARAEGINDASEVVGSSLVPSGAVAFVWNEWDGILPLDSLIHPDDPLYGKVNLTTAWDINELGWIVADGYRFDDPGVVHAFVLMPLELSAAYLTTGSPVSIAQTVDTPDTPSDLSFDYRFETSTGVLTVSLDDAVLASIPAAISTRLQTQKVTVDALHLGKSGVELRFELDGPAGSVVALDNVLFPGLINGRFASGDLFGWAADTPPGGSADVLDLVVTEELAVALDIFPWRSQNVFVPIPLGLVRTAILGTSELDVARIDPETVTLEGVEPIRSWLVDVGSPVRPRTTELQAGHCLTDGRDGIKDLLLVFPKGEIVESLDALQHHDVLVLTLTGELDDGTPIVGEDEIVIWAPWK